MTHQQLITTPDIDLMQLAERQGCEPSLKKRILAHLATLGVPTVNHWLRKQRHFDHARLGVRVRVASNLRVSQVAGVTSDNKLEKGATRAEILSYADTL